MSEQQVRNENIAVSLLDGFAKNYRSHPPEQIKQLVASLQRFQQVRSIVVKKQAGCDRYTILAGHGLVEAARECFYPELRCDIVPDSWDAMTCSAYLIADNNLSNMASDDEALLAELLQEQQDAGYDLAALGSDDETLRQMLASLGDEILSGDGEEEEEDDFDAVPDVTQTRVQVGDIWQLGRHTIACLDSLNPATYEKLFATMKPDMVFADPPYGINIVATNVSVGGGEAYDIPFGGVKNRGDVGGTASHIRRTGKSYLEESRQKSKGLGSIGGAKPFGSKSDRGTVGNWGANIVDVGKYAPVIGDDTTATATTAYQLCAELFPDALQVWWGANYYSHIFPPSKCWIVWDKENTGNFADAELAWCSSDSVVRIFKHMWNGMLKDSEHGQRRVHPTQKPCALFCWCAEKYGKSDDVIYDPFLGSGISVIGAEMLNDGRSIIGCELSPEYIDIIITRWEKFTGQTATLLERVEEIAHV